MRPLIEFEILNNYEGTKLLAGSLKTRFDVHIIWPVAILLKSRIRPPRKVVSNVVIPKVWKHPMRNPVYANMPGPPSRTFF